MFDINDDKPMPEVLAKTYPAQDLLKKPGWHCQRCSHVNPVTAPFCEQCEEHQ